MHNFALIRIFIWKIFYFHLFIYIYIFYSLCLRLEFLSFVWFKVSLYAFYFTACVFMRHSCVRSTSLTSQQFAFNSIVTFTVTQCCCFCVTLFFFTVASFSVSSFHQALHCYYDLSTAAVICGVATRLPLLFNLPFCVAGCWLSFSLLYFKFWLHFSLYQICFVLA